MSGTSTLEHDYSTASLVDALLVGPWRKGEFAASIATIERWQRFPQLPTLEDACESLLAVDVAPELILLAQPLPGTIAQTDVDRLQQLAPLARIVIVAGTWCEGELRTGRPCRGVLRLYWYELAPWLEAATRRIAAGKYPSWSQPLDHFQSGRFSTEASLPALPTSIAIDAEDYSVFETLASAIIQAGGSAVWAKDKTDITADAGIWDGGQLGASEEVRLRDFSRLVTGNVVALLDFPRVEHLRAAREAGATDVFGKPYIVEEVLAALSCNPRPFAGVARE